MTFGCVSSPQRFDVASDVVKEIAALNVNMKKEDIPKCLDDAIPIQTRVSGLVRKFEIEYRRLCRVIGVRLAGNDYAGKTFSVSRAGEVLGIMYELGHWLWWIPEAKALRLIAELKMIVESDMVEGPLMEKIMGKLSR